MGQKKSEEKDRSPSKIAVTRYANKIEMFLRKENRPYSERRIAERVFNLVLGKEGNIPASKKDISGSCHILETL